MRALRAWGLKNDWLTTSKSTPTCASRLADGSLFRLSSGRVWAALGGGHNCEVCGDLILETQPQYEIREGKHAYAHVVCFSIWLVESKILDASAE